MNVKLSEAVKMFFSTSSLEMVYFEAIGNALDANASTIDVIISIQATSKIKSLSITIKDDGEGFTDKRFKKFSNLFDVEEASHKGLGRLVYLFYFDKINISSFYEGNKNRTFLFSEDFTETSSIIEKVEECATGTTITMNSCKLNKLHKNDYVSEIYLKNRILEEFYSRLFQMKNAGHFVKISITSNIGGIKKTKTIENKSMPDMQLRQLEIPMDLFSKWNLHYSIIECKIEDTSFISAISVDNRTVKVDLIADENIPKKYQMVFLLLSDYFDGKADSTRQALTIPPKIFKKIQDLFRNEVSKLIIDSIPSVKTKNNEIKKGLINKFPHLSGYFDEENIGLIKRNDILDNAQKKFFKSQKEILDADSLTQEQFLKSLEISSRALTEYILFRQVTIANLKKTTSETPETELHSLFASMGRNGRFDKQNIISDLYRNNAWLLDDKYMTYETILSDREMTELVSEITKGEIFIKNSDRPDLALLFSNNPKNNDPFDVVIVEIKKRGVSEYDNLKANQQLEKRARSLMKYYNNQIQRIWYYSIIELNEDVELALAGEYKELYSSGKMYHKVTNVAIKLKPLETLPINVFVWDIDAVIKDASHRNNVFLNVIKSKFLEDLN